jgi:hypothetical protein
MFIFRSFMVRDFGVILADSANKRVMDDGGSRPIFFTHRIFLCRPRQDSCRCAEDSCELGREFERVDPAPTETLVAG